MNFSGLAPAITHFKPRGIPLQHYQLPRSRETGAAARCRKVRCDALRCRIVSSLLDKQADRTEEDMQIGGRVVTPGGGVRRNT